MTLQIVPWPHSALKTPADPVEQTTDHVRDVWHQMVSIMEAMPGYGLAAVQVGVPLRLAVVDAGTLRGQAILLANPDIISSGPELFEHVEASPNLPGVAAKLKRSANVTVQYLDEIGNWTQRDFEGLWSTSVQHQIDHLNGKMFFDNLSRTRRNMLLKKAEKHIQ